MGSINMSQVTLAFDSGGWPHHIGCPGCWDENQPLAIQLDEDEATILGFHCDACHKDWSVEEVDKKLLEKLLKTSPDMRLL
jgi:hypothetical protein